MNDNDHVNNDMNLLQPVHMQPVHILVHNLFTSCNLFWTGEQCSHPSLFNFIRWHHASGWEQLIHATHPTIWSVGKSTFLHDVYLAYKHCFLPMLLVFAMKCCTKMPCPLPHNHYCCLLPSPIYACLTCSSVHASSLHPLLAHHYLCYFDVYCVFFIFSYFCYMLHFFVAPFWLVCVMCTIIRPISFVSIFVSFSVFFKLTC